MSMVNGFAAGAHDEANDEDLSKLDALPPPGGAADVGINPLFNGADLGSGGAAEEAGDDFLIDEVFSAM